MRNNLDRETSPYLLQHKDNPVHWQAWGQETLASAQQQNKPILLSVGYAACHWCHVMAHESFENDGIAALMNELFVNIKVDREERPDLDTIYQSALALLGAAGRLAADHVPDAGGRAVLGRHLLPADRALRPPRLCRRAAEDRAPSIANKPQRVAEECRGAARRARQARDAASAATPSRSTSSTGSASGCCPKSIPSMAASVRRRNFRRRPSSS